MKSCILLLSVKLSLGFLDVHTMALLPTKLRTLAQTISSFVTCTMLTLALYSKSAFLGFYNVTDTSPETLFSLCERCVFAFESLFGKTERVLL